MLDLSNIIAIAALVVIAYALKALGKSYATSLQK